LPEDVKKWISSKSLLGDPKAETSRDLLFFPVVNPSNNKLNKGALNSVMSGRGAQAEISSGARSSARNKAEHLLKTNFKKAVEGQKMSECQDKTQKIEATENWMSYVPEGQKTALVAAMEAYKDNKKKHIKTIIGCKSVEFCEEGLGKINSLSVLESIATLVKAAEASEGVESQAKTLAQATEHPTNYQLHSLQGQDATIPPSLGYVPFNDASY
jgi:hypothetical protein